MADGVTEPAVMGAGAKPPSPAPPGAQQLASTGSSPATMPVPNRGDQAAGMVHLSAGIHVLEEAFHLLGMGSEAGRDVHSVLPKLAKHVPPGSISSGVENSVLQKIMLKNRQNAMSVQQMRAGPQQQQPPRPPGMPAPGAPSGAPTPMAA